MRSEYLSVVVGSSLSIALASCSDLCSDRYQEGYDKGYQNGQMVLSDSFIPTVGGSILIGTGIFTITIVCFLLWILFKSVIDDWHEEMKEKVRIRQQKKYVRIKKTNLDKELLIKSFEEINELLFGKKDKDGGNL